MEKYRIEMFRKLRAYNKIFNESYIILDTSRSTYTPNWYLYDKYKKIICSIICNYITKISHFNENYTNV